ncbi:MAG: aminotransferase class III-fold pyridoxal phosphate-dependent enzyme, partial [Thermomicrobiales bacterium]|nr:aminotransferase class III-fold pyridoxal phosphate-dependent enzyme [Thermomicrobiales bacterium]
RGMGLMVGVELVGDKETKEPVPDIANAVLSEAKRRGLIVGKGGLDGNTLRISPPLIVTNDDVDAAIAILDETFTAAEANPA